MKTRLTPLFALVAGCGSADEPVERPGLSEASSLLLPTNAHANLGTKSPKHSVATAAKANANALAKSRGNGHNQWAKNMCEKARKNCEKKAVICAEQIAACEEKVEACEQKSQACEKNPKSKACEKQAQNCDQKSDRCAQKTELCEEFQKRCKNKKRWCDDSTDAGDDANDEAADDDDECDDHDDEPVPTFCQPGETADCYSGSSDTLGVGTCHGGSKTCLPDGSAFGPCADDVVPTSEDCSTEVDEDCDGVVNANCVCPSNTVLDCYDGPTGTQDVGICSSGGRVCNSTGTSLGECIGQVLPEIEEDCSTDYDDNCDGQVNEGCCDTDGARQCNGSATQVCADGRWTDEMACPSGANSVAACTVGLCGLVCDPGSYDCNGRSVDGCESTSPCAVQFLTQAWTEQGPTQVIVDDVAAYWTNVGGSVRSVLKSGGTPVSLLSGLSTPHRIAQDSDSLYFTNGTDGRVMKMSKRGGNVEVLATGQGSPTGLVLLGSQLFWANYTPNASLMTLKDGAVTTLVSGVGNPHDLTTDGSRLFFTDIDGRKIRRANLDGSAPTIIASLSTLPFAVISDGTSVYWSEDSVNGRIAKASVNGGAITTLVSGQNRPHGLVFDGADKIYFTNYGSGEIVRMTKTGASKTVIASGQSGAGAVQTDNTHAYWSVYSNGGHIAKAAK